MLDTLAQNLDGSILITACILLFVLALLLLATVWAMRREMLFAVDLSRDRARKMNELLRTIRMAESIAELGIWQFNPSTGEQQWSNGMRALFGVDKDEDFVAGDAETLLFANDIDLVRHVGECSDENSLYDLRYDIHGYDGEPRSINVQACNLRDENGQVLRVVAVIRDVTDQIERERALEQSRQIAVREAERARKLADTDPLTGLANRRRVMSELDRLVMKARANEQPISLIVFDIDHFKRVNDNYGHPHGDLVLQRVAEIAMRQAREDDVIGRVGGEEFVWIVPGVDASFTNVLSERLRLAIAVGTIIDDRPPVTISAGFTSLTPGDAALSLFARADEALYEAKNGGRNQVRMAA